MIAATGTANPVPLINQPLVPDAVAPGGAGFTLTVNGTGFVSGSVVNWNGSARTTTFVNRSRLTASILSSDIGTASTASVTVVNPSPGGGASNTLFLEVTTPTSSVTLWRSDYAVGSSPHWVSTGDLNGDGKLDLVTANRYGNRVSVLLGNGDGTFQPQVTYATGTGPLGVAIGDFNGDGELDLAVVNQSANSVSILLGNGDGTFRAKVDYATGNEPLSVVAGDFNGDGKLDLAVTNGSGNTVSILLGNGDGTFQPKVPYATGARPFPVTTGDFNGDGKLDLAVGNQNGNSISILLGNGDGTFQTQVSYAVSSQVYSVTTADFNGDGKLDLAAANNSDNTVSVLLGNGDGTFQTQVRYPTPSGPHSLIAADFNGDGKLDLAVANENASSASILLGNGDGTFQAHADYPTGSGAISPAAGDFNGDGRIDLAIADYNQNTVSVLLQSSISLSKIALNFSPQVIRTSSAPQKVKLINIGNSAVTIRSIAVTGTDATDFGETNTCPSTLPVGQGCIISVTFTPTQLGMRTAAVTITDSAPGSPQSVALSGTGVTSGPNATLSPTHMSFYYTNICWPGCCLQPSPPQTATLTNWGNETLNITSITITDNHFSQWHTCGTSLGPLQSCTITVSFQSGHGNFTGALHVYDNAPGSPQSVVLTGSNQVICPP
jgi:ankyrin repeat protein